LAGEDKSFCAVSLLTALEGNSAMLNIRKAGKIPAAATLLQEEEKAVGNEAEILSSHGYKRIKLKIGANIKYEINKINFILNKLPKDTKLRLDANQCLTIKKAIKLWEEINHQQIEYIEQPFPRGDWDSLQRYCQEDKVRICLDESIFSIIDLEKMEKLDYQFWVKLKLMKMGSVSELVRCVKWLNERSYPIILGNGVQSDLGSFFEYSIYKELELSTAAELNGFAKQKITPFNFVPLKMQDGYIVFSGHEEQSINMDDDLNIIKDFWEKSL
ncbi:MAG TPA: mandelate racemase/muconate lactonizing enzyme family protein, partial [Bacteroidales bacterium]|nr:mandelate racemase/muconate lactonizing enzyme family protein [Bacteroidales bacterium]